MELCLLQPLKNSIEIMLVILLHTAEYQNTIKVNYNARIKSIKNNLIDHPLKCTWGIHKPKWHNKVLKSTIPTRKSNFVYIFICNRDVEIPIPDI